MMKLLFKQKMFSWFDSYNVFSAAGEIVYTVKGQLSWGHLLKIFDRNDREVGTVKQRLFTFLPRFEMYAGNTYLGHIQKEFSFFKPRFRIDCKGWYVEGNFWEWDYRILDSAGCTVATVSREIAWTDTYSIDVYDPADALYALMLVIAIDAEKCSRN